MNCNVWEVWAAQVKFEDTLEIKPRPVLILQNNTTYAVCLKMTGSAPRYGEYALIEWSAVGLYKPTTVRVKKVLKLTPHDLQYKIGDLTPLDISNIQALILQK